MSLIMLHPAARVEKNCFSYTPLRNRRIAARICAYISFMKINKVVRLLTAFILAAAFLCACAPRAESKGDASLRLNTYNIEAAYRDNTHSLTAVETLSYTNRTGGEIAKLWFNLYPNAYREEAVYKAVAVANRAKAYPAGASYGHIEINYARVRGTAAGFVVTGNDKNILEVSLPEPLADGGKAEVEISFTTYLANVYDRLGWNSKTVSLTNFYPILCVYENGGFVVENYSPYGDPFYSEAANYNVTFSYPEKYSVAFTGDGAAGAAAGDGKTIVVTAKCVRDFAIALSALKTMVSEKVGDITVNYHYTSDTKPDESLRLAVRAMEAFQEMFGAYPYDKIEIFETQFIHGGMEYPGLVLVAAGQAKTDRDEVIVHELCHQWWYGLVGNNQHDEAWIDEGLTDFCTLLFFEKYPEYGIDKNTRIKQSGLNYALFADVLKSLSEGGDTTMTRKLLDYESEREYVFMTYVKGMLLFDAIYKITGEKAFLKGLQRLYAENVFGIVTDKEVIDALEKASRKKLSGIFRSWLDGKVVIARLVG